MSLWCVCRMGIILVWLFVIGMPCKENLAGFDKKESSEIHKANQGAP